MEPGPNGGTPPVYKSAPEPRLIGFQPFDLEAWWYVKLVKAFKINCLCTPF